MGAALYLIVLEPLDVVRRARVSDCQLTQEGQIGANLHAVITGLILVENRPCSYNSGRGLDLDGVVDASEDVPDDASVIPVIVVPVVIDYQRFSTPGNQDLRASSFLLIVLFQFFSIFIPESFGFRTTFFKRTLQLNPMTVVASLQSLHLILG